MFMLQQAAQAVEQTMRQEVFTRLDAIAAKLGILSTHLWEVLIRQAYAAAAVNLVWTVLLTVLAIIMYRVTRKGFNLALDGDDDAGFAAIGGGLLFVASASIAAVCLSEAMSAIINPEYWAFAKVLNLVSGK